MEHQAVEILKKQEAFEAKLKAAEEEADRLVKEAGLPMNAPMVMNEGGAASPLWRQIIADVFDMPNVLVASRVGAPYGDALLAGVACGAFPGFSVVTQWVRTVQPVEPDAARVARYRELFVLYRRLYEHLKDDFQEIARLRREAVAAVYQKAGAKVFDLDDATLAKWQALAKPVWKDFADKNENCAKLLAAAQKLL